MGERDTLICRVPVSARPIITTAAASIQIVINRLLGSLRITKGSPLVGGDARTGSRCYPSLKVPTRGSVAAKWPRSRLRVSSARCRANASQGSKPGLMLRDALQRVQNEFIAPSTRLRCDILQHEALTYSLYAIALLTASALPRHRRENRGRCRSAPRIRCE